MLDYGLNIVYCEFWICGVFMCAWEGVCAYVRICVRVRVRTEL